MLGSLYSFQDEVQHAMYWDSNCNNEATFNTFKRRTRTLDAHKARSQKKARRKLNFTLFSHENHKKLLETICGIYVANPETSV